MIIKDKTKNRIIGGEKYDPMIAISFEEICCMCGLEIPDKATILRHETTKHILCVLCLVDIASINPDD